MSFINELSKAISQTNVIEKNGKRVVVKRYNRPIGLLKWIAVALPPLVSYYPIETNPLIRMIREESFFTKPPENVYTPKIISVDYERLVIEREYIPGKPLNPSSINDARLLGETLASIHNQNYCLGDCRVDNFIKSTGKVYVVDAEQSITRCLKNDYKVWDFLLSIVFLYLQTPPLKKLMCRESISAFIEGYESSRSTPRWSDLKRIKSLLIFLPAPYISFLRKRLS